MRLSSWRARTGPALPVLPEPPSGAGQTHCSGKSLWTGSKQSTLLWGNCLEPPITAPEQGPHPQTPSPGCLPLAVGVRPRQQTLAHAAPDPLLRPLDILPKCINETWPRESPRHRTGPSSWPGMGLPEGGRISECGEECVQVEGPEEKRIAGKSIQSMEETNRRNRAVEGQERVG